MAQAHLADCLLCDWSQIAENDATAKSLSVCHAVLRHPDEYQEATGKDASVARYDYREFIAAYKKDL